MTPPQPALTQATLCFLFRSTPLVEVLLGYKKRGFGQGKWTGFGGKVESEETVIQAAQRELYEETGVAVDLADLQPSGQVIFRFPAKPTWDQRVHLFVVTNWQGEAVESEEMRPAWFFIDKLPSDRMWDDARYWLPDLLSEAMVNLQITFAADNATVTRHAPAMPRA